jgi:hypothetical protein
MINAGDLGKTAGQIYGQMPNGVDIFVAVFLEWRCHKFVDETP